MESWLNPLTGRLVDHIQGHKPLNLGALGVFHAHSKQLLKAIPIYNPSLIFVLCGTKVLEESGQTVTAEGGQVILLAGNTQLTLANLPDKTAQSYLAVTVSFSDEDLQRYRTLMPAPNVAPFRTQKVKTVRITDDMGHCLNDWLSLYQKQNVSPLRLQLKAFEMLTLLDEQSVLHTLLHGHKPSWKNRVIELIQSDLARNWQVSEVCETLNVSESTLRRNLQQEKSGFRNLLEDCRLLTALGMLQASYRPIAHIALDVGYVNQAHFSERFKNRFGLSPREVRASRELISI